jgi:hypothetical protein
VKRNSGFAIIKSFKGKVTVTHTRKAREEAEFDTAVTADVFS